MKMTSNKILRPVTLLAVLWLLVMATGCTRKFDEFNTDETRLTNLTPTEFPRLFSRAQAASSFINWRYQYGQNLFADLYSQYFFLTATYPYDRFSYASSDLEIVWRVIYTEVVPQLKTLMEE